MRGRAKADISEMMRWKQKDRHTAVLTLKDPLDRRCSMT
jgi:hypothetical protein